MMSIPLILLHGAIGSKSQFDGLKAALEDAFVVHAIDFEGHGARSDAGRDFRTMHFVENVLAYMDEAGIEKANFFGHSLGGYVSLALADHAPERVNQIFTFGVMFDWTPEVAAKQVRNMNAERIMEKVPHFGAMLEARHTGMGWRENMAKSAEMTTALGDEPYITSELLAKVAHRVMITLGDRDNATTLTESETAFRTLPNADLQVFPRTYHPLKKLDVDMMAAAIKRFLGEKG